MHAHTHTHTHTHIRAADRGEGRKQMGVFCLWLYLVRAWSPNKHYQLIKPIKSVLYAWCVYWLNLAVSVAHYCTRSILHNRLLPFVDKVALISRHSCMYFLSLLNVLLHSSHTTCTLMAVITSSCDFNPVVQIALHLPLDVVHVTSSYQSTSSTSTTSTTFEIS